MQCTCCRFSVLLKRNPNYLAYNNYKEQIIVYLVLANHLPNGKLATTCIKNQLTYVSVQITQHQLNYLAEIFNIK